MFIINLAGPTSPPGGRRRAPARSKSPTALRRKSAANQTSDMKRDKGTRGQGDKGTRNSKLLVSLAPCLLVLLLAFSTPTTGAQPAAIRFTDVTAQSGITFRHVASPEKKYLAESMSGGLAVF